MRTADAIDLASRTLNTEVDVPNKAGQLAARRLRAGASPGESDRRTTCKCPLTLFSSAAEGLRAVVIDENHKTHLQSLTIGRDYGTALEVLQGLKATDWIVLNPADSLEEGMPVNVKEVPQGHLLAEPATRRAARTNWRRAQDERLSTPSGNKP